MKHDQPVAVEQAVRPATAMARVGLASLWRRVTLAILGMLCCAGLLVGGAYAAIHYDGNFHEVNAGQFYRSAQVAPDDLHEVVLRYGIKTVLNLRGDNTGSAWYDDELAATKADGVLHLDFRMSALRTLSVPQMRDVLAVVERAPKPILVHCNGGSDRTGLVSALYVVHETQDPSLASKQLSLRYGHFPYLGSRSVAMDKSLESFVRSNGHESISNEPRGSP